MNKISVCVTLDFVIPEDRDIHQHPIKLQHIYMDIPDNSQAFKFRRGLPVPNSLSISVPAKNRKAFILITDPSQRSQAGNVAFGHLILLVIRTGLLRQGVSSSRTVHKSPDYNVLTASSPDS